MALPVAWYMHAARDKRGAAHTGKPCAEQKRIISDFPKNLQKIEKDQRTGSPAETTTTKPPQPTSYIYIEFFHTAITQLDI